MYSSADNIFCCLKPYGAKKQVHKGKLITHVRWPWLHYFILYKLYYYDVAGGLMLTCPKC